MARDGWDKAQVVSGFMSSVVIALVGIGVTFSLQRAQIATARTNAQVQAEAAAVRARSEQTLQESRLTADLLDYLSSPQPVKRELAIQALASAVPSATYEDVVAVIARSDTSSSVRRAALGRLSASNRPAILDVLVQFAADSTRRESERAQARASARVVALRSGLGRDTYVFGASEGVEAMELASLGHGAFTYALLSALEGEADLDSDGSVGAFELASFLAYRVPQLSEGQTPVSVYSGSASTALNGHHNRKLVGVFIGISDYRAAGLQTPVKDARSVHELYLRTAPAQSALQLLLDSAATRSAVVDAIAKAATAADSTTLLVLYFAGHGGVDARGEPGWILHDYDLPGRGESLPLDEVKAILRRSKARAKVMFIDASFALPGAAR